MTDSRCPNPSCGKLVPAGKKFCTACGSPVSTASLHSSHRHHAGERGTCGTCRHANHGTEDASEGVWACPWVGPTDPHRPCRIQYQATEQYVFELFNGSNCTWRREGTFRAVPHGYEDKPIVPAGDEPPSADLELSLHPEPDPPIREDRDLVERLIGVVNDPALLCFTDDVGWLKWLWSGGSVGEGSLVLTNCRLIFLKSRTMQRLGAICPKPASLIEVEETLARQGGLMIPLAEVAEVFLSAQGWGRFGAGTGSISEISVRYGPKPTTVAFRLYGEDTAPPVLGQIKQQLQAVRGGQRPPTAPPPRSPVAAELEEAGLPENFGLPATPDDLPIITWCRATVGFAMKTFKAGNFQLAIHDANKLINDDRVRQDPRQTWFLAAAYYIRGLAHEQLEQRSEARADYQSALRLRPGYPHAAGRLAQLPS